MSKGLYFSVIKEEPINKTAKNEFEKRKRNKVAQNKIDNTAPKSHVDLGLFDNKSSEINCSESDKYIDEHIRILTTLGNKSDRGQMHSLISLKQDLKDHIEKCGESSISKDKLAIIKEIEENIYKEEIVITDISDDDINCKFADEDIKERLKLLLLAKQARNPNNSKIASHQNILDKIYNKCEKNMDKKVVDSASDASKKVVNSTSATLESSSKSLQSNGLNISNICDQKDLGSTVLHKIRDIVINDNALKNGPISKIMNFNTNQYETIDLEKEIFNAHEYIASIYGKCKPELYNYKKDIEGFLSIKPPLPLNFEQQSCNFMSAYQSLFKELRQNQKNIEAIKFWMEKLYIIYETCGNKTEAINDLYLTISKEYKMTLLYYESQKDICNLQQLFNDVLTSMNANPVHLRLLTNQIVKLTREYDNCTYKNEQTVNIYNDIQSKFDEILKNVDAYINDFTIKIKNRMLILESEQKLSIKIINDCRKIVADERAKFGLRIDSREKGNNQDFLISAQSCIDNINNRIFECNKALKEFISTMIIMKNNNTITPQIYNRGILKIEDMYRNCQPVKNIKDVYPFLKEYDAVHKEYVEYFKNRAIAQAAKQNYQSASSCNIL